MYERCIKIVHCPCKKKVFRAEGLWDPVWCCRWIWTLCECWCESLETFCFKPRWQNHEKMSRSSNCPVSTSSSRKPLVLLSAFLWVVACVRASCFSPPERNDKKPTVRNDSIMKPEWQTSVQMFWRFIVHCFHSSTCCGMPSTGIHQIFCQITIFKVRQIKERLHWAINTLIYHIWHHKDVIEETKTNLTYFPPLSQADLMWADFSLDLPSVRKKNVTL